VEIFVLTSDFIDKETPPEPTMTNMSFSLDNSPPVFFTHLPNGTAEDDLTFNYNVSAFAVANLDLRNHTMAIESFGASMTNFDYATYE
jgi:hypothetical protein